MDFASIYAFVYQIFQFWGSLISIQFILYELTFKAISLEVLYAFVYQI